MCPTCGRPQDNSLVLCDNCASINRLMCEYMEAEAAGNFEELKTIVEELKWRVSNDC